MCDIHPIREMATALTSGFRLWLNLFHEKDRFSDYICNFVSDIKVLYLELYLILKISS